MLEINGKEFTPDEDLVIQGDEFSACDIEQPAVIRNPFPYYDLMRQKPIQYGVRGYPPGADLRFEPGTWVWSLGLGSTASAEGF